MIYLKCFICNKCLDTDIKNLINHFKSSHNLKNGLKCGLYVDKGNICNKEYNSYGGLEKHMKQCKQALIKIGKVIIISIFRIY